jgi:hypothetical protein
MVGLAFLAGGAIMADAIRREARRTGRA